MYGLIFFHLRYKETMTENTILPPNHLREKRHYPLSDYWKERFGCKVYKITIDAGFDCPNRDGTKSSGGCTFCDEVGSFARHQSNLLKIEEQLRVGIETMNPKLRAQKYFAYLQAFTNTYGTIDHLKIVYDRVLDHPDVVGLSIGTRPDCVDRDKIDLIASYVNENREVWIEYGMQTIHDRTLKKINRGETHADFCNAMALTRPTPIKSCAHVILGLPNETHTDMMATAHKLADIGVDGVKLHLLCVMQDSPLEKVYATGKLSLMEREDYINTVCDFLEYTPSNVIIHRLAGNGHHEHIIAPLWLSEKMQTMDMIIAEMKRRNTWQGKKA